jgi:hypothetical protein
MDAQVKAEWVAALRSGKYKQDIGYLKRDTVNGPRYCCLGVLCEVIDPNKFTQLQNGIYDYGLHGFATHMTVPTNVQRDIGLSDEECDTLTCMNDAHDSFEFIADFIEYNV